MFLEVASYRRFRLRGGRLDMGLPRRVLSPRTNRAAWRTRTAQRRAAWAWRFVALSPG